LGEGVGGARVAQRLRRRGTRATGGAHHRGQRRVWAGAGGAAPRWAMHPHLDEVAHPACVEAIRALKACHEGGTWRKFVGFCNGEDSALARCLKAERLQARADNYARARERGARTIAKRTAAEEAAAAAR